MDRCYIRSWFFMKPLAVTVAVVVIALPPTAAQYFRKPSSAYPYDVGGNVSSPVKIILGVLIFGMFLIAFISLYLRTCLYHSSAETRPTLTVTNNHRLRRKFPCGLDRSVIESFPVFLYSDVKERMLGERTLECAVCISEFTDDEHLRFLPKCHHVFHPDCIDDWLASHTTCPVCRADLTTGNLNGHSEFNQELISLQIDESRTEIETQNHDSINVEQEQEATRFPRSHSTGHSLVTPGENCERYTLRLPEEVQNQIVALRRAKSCSCNVDGNSRRGGAEGSSGGRRWTSDRLICGRSDPPDLAVTRIPTIDVETDQVQSSSSSTSAALPV